MDSKEILKQALEGSGMNQAQLAKKMDVARPTMSTSLRRDNIGLDLFAKILSAMGYTMYVGTGEDEQFQPMWKVDGVKPKREARNNLGKD